MSKRGLPNKRAHEVVEFDLDGAHYSAGVGRYENGAIAEVFLDAGKPGSALQASSRDAAVILSIALQYGVPADAFRAAVTRNDDGTAAGPIGEVLDRSIGG